MKSKDIEVGKVYGFREGRSIYDHIYQVKFLAPVSELYTYDDRSKRIKRSTARKPQSRSIYPPDGYLVALGSDVTGTVPGPSLESALETGVSWGHSDTFDYRIITNMAAVIGPDYATAHAEQEQARKERSDSWEARQAQRDAETARSQSYVDRLARHGIKAWKGDHGGIEIWADEAEKLVRLLDSPPHQVIVDSLSGLQEEMKKQAEDAAKEITHRELGICSGCTRECTLWPSCQMQSDN